MVCSVEVAICSQLHSKQVNTVCGQNIDFFLFCFLSFESDGTLSNLRALKGSFIWNRYISNELFTK